MTKDIEELLPIAKLSRSLRGVQLYNSGSQVTFFPLCFFGLSALLFSQFKLRCFFLFNLARVCVRKKAIELVTCVHAPDENYSKKRKHIFLFLVWKKW